MSCQRCESERVASFGGKCSDMFWLDMGDIKVENDYAPRDFGIGGGDYIDVTYCLDCGQMQGEFPLDETELEMNAAADDDEYEDEEEF